ncbi:MAG TPA: hypothetical protein VFQ61_26935, partial [Polyangiaceae bacterium]|nr:hypothetical protein [Polyangiaceae bacterium]
LLLALPFLKKTRKLWFLVAWIHVAIFAWYAVHHQDRYLQGIVPLMAAVVAAILVSIFHGFGWLVRGACSLLVLAQIVWGGDVYFFQTHSMAKSALKKTLDLLSAGFERKYEERLRVSGSLAALREYLPAGSRVLLHQRHPHLGLAAESVLDSFAWQFGLDYGAQKTPEGVRRLLREQGITHVFFEPGKGNAMHPLANDLLFHEFASRFTTDRVRVGGATLARVPDQPSTRPFQGHVAVLNCESMPYPGLYETETLNVLEYGPKQDDYEAALAGADDVHGALTLLPQADFAIVEPKCFPEGLPRALTSAFELFVKRQREPREIWRRTRTGAAVLEESSAPLQPSVTPESSRRPGRQPRSALEDNVDSSETDE